MVAFTFGSASPASSSGTTSTARSANPITSSALPPDHPPIPASADSCPVDESVRHKYLSSTPSANPLHSTSSSPGGSSSKGKGYLSQEREISSIPRATTSTSSHMGSSEGSGLETDEKWVYPSEEQFFKAMQRKKHNPQARDMKSVVPIHNAVNEKAWEDILMWEVGMGSEKCGGPRLISFAGKPKVRTPKAWVNVAMGYTAPFDRHDWIIDRCGTQVRYVIDFYSGKADPNNPRNMAFYLDVRPALDDYNGVETRVKGWWRQFVG